METLISKTRFFSSIGTKLAIGCIIASTLSLLPISPALADRDGWGERGGDREGGWHGGDRDGGWRGGDHDDWRRREGYGNGYGGYGGYFQQPVYPQPYSYAQPVYVPPPVRYLPPQSPGINLVFPLNFR